MSSSAPSVGLAIRGALVNYSGTIIQANRSQKLLSGNNNWNYQFIQNPSNAIESLFINFGADATTTGNDSMELLPGQFLYFKTPGFISNQQINIIAATMGHAFVCFAA